VVTFSLEGGVVNTPMPCGCFIEVFKCAWSLSPFPPIVDCAKDLANAAIYINFRNSVGNIVKMEASFMKVAEI
jgi:hypothetical protein